MRCARTHTHTHTHTCSPRFLVLLLTSLIVYVLCPLAAAVWLHSDDAFLRFCCESLSNMEELLSEVCSFFVEFGQYTSLNLNLTKTRALLQGMGPWPEKVVDIAVVSSVKYLGALFGDAMPDVAFD